MRAAAALEDGTEKSAVTPGPLAPARELVGEMLLQMNQPAEALKEFEATLEEGAEQVPRPVWRRQVGLARRRSSESAHVCRVAAEDLRARRQARTAGARRSASIGTELTVARSRHALARFDSGIWHNLRTEGLELCNFDQRWLWFRR